MFLPFQPPSMESISSLFFFATLIIIILFKLTKKSHSKLPPGPWQLPVIGSIHHLLSSQLPHQRLRELSTIHGPLMHLKLGEVSMVVASSPEAAQEIMRTHDVNFATRPLFPAMDIFSYNGKSMSFGPYGEYWRQLRKTCILELLSAKQIHSFQCTREQEAQNLIHSISLKSHEGSLVNLSKMLSQMTCNITMRAVVGNKLKERDRFLESLDEGIALAAGFDLTDLFPSLGCLLNLVSRYKSKVERCHQKQDQILEGILQGHKERKNMKDGGCRSEEQEAEDFVDVLLRLQEEGNLQFQLSDEGIKALLLDMFGAGSETSSSTLQWAMSELMRNPRVMKKAQMEVRHAFQGKAKVTEAGIKELRYLQLIIKESLRLHPPLPLLLPRECQQKCEVLGYEIQAKARILVNAWAIGRDPQYWKDAEEFKPERFEGSKVDFKGANFELLPFGAGRRMCPGMLFGLATVELPLALLLNYFDWEPPIDPEMKSKSLDVSESVGITAHKKFDLLLHAIPYTPDLEA